MHVSACEPQFRLHACVEQPNHSSSCQIYVYVYTTQTTTRNTFQALLRKTIHIFSHVRLAVRPLVVHRRRVSGCTPACSNMQAFRRRLKCMPFLNTAAMASTV